MATTLAGDVLQDDMAVALARVIASANRRARELSVRTPSQAVEEQGRHRPGVLADLVAFRSL
jgi:hypothetical protein